VVVAMVMFDVLDITAFIPASYLYDGSKAVLGALISALRLNSNPTHYADAHMAGQSWVCLQYFPGAVIRMPSPMTSESHIRWQNGSSTFQHRV
jgi:hypothetical protein